MSECDKLKVGTRKRSICEGSANLSLEKINAYRASWGLGPIAADDPIREGVIVPVPPVAPVRETRSVSGHKPCKTCGGKERTPRAIQPPKKKGLGDRAEQALTFVGITTERVERWLGGPCGCAERKEKLNRWGAWVTSVVTGRNDDAEGSLKELIKK